MRTNTVFWSSQVLTSSYAVTQWSLGSASCYWRASCESGCVKKQTATCGSIGKGCLVWCDLACFVWVTLTEGKRQWVCVPSEFLLDVFMCWFRCTFEPQGAQTPIYKDKCAQNASNQNSTKPIGTKHTRKPHQGHTQPKPKHSQSAEVPPTSWAIWEQLSPWRICGWDEAQGDVRCMKIFPRTTSCYPKAKQSEKKQTTSMRTWCLSQKILQT